VFLFIGDHEPPSHGKWGNSNSRTNSVSQTAYWNAKLVRLSRLNLGALLLNILLQRLAKEISTLTLWTEYLTQRGLISHFYSSDTLTTDH